jgi:hypothetical protein
VLPAAVGQVINPFDSVSGFFPLAVYRASFFADYHDTGGQGHAGVFAVRLHAGSLTWQATQPKMTIFGKLVRNFHSNGKL